MQGSLVPIRLVLIMAAVLTGLLFVLGIFNWDKNRYACLNGQHFYGDWVVTAAIGKLELRQMAWGCPPNDRYNPAEVKPTTLQNLPPVNTN